MITLEAEIFQHNRSRFIETMNNAHRSALLVQGVVDDLSEKTVNLVILKPVIPMLLHC